VCLGSTGDFGGSLTTNGPVNLSAAGYAVRASNVTLDSSGLYADNLDLSLASSFGGAGLKAGRAYFNTDGSLKGTTLDPTTADITYQGFGVHVEGLSLSGGRLTAGVFRVTVPPSVVPDGVDNTLTARNIDLGADGTVRGNLQFPSMTLRYNGFTLTARGITLGNAGLTVSDAELDVPSSLLPQGSGQLTIAGSLTIAADGTIGGALSAGGNDVHFLVGGFPVGVQALTLDGSGLLASGASITLPVSLSSAVTATIVLTGDLSISSSFQVSAHLTDKHVALQFGSLPVQAGDITLTEAGMAIHNASYTLPAAFCGATLAADTLNVDTNYVITGSLTAQNACFTYQGYKLTVKTISLTATANPQSGSAAGTLQISGAQLALPAIADGPFTGDLTATVDASGNVQVVSGSLSATGIHLTVAGFKLTADSATLDNTGLHATKVALALPSAFGGAALTAPTLSIDKDGNITGAATLSPDVINLSYLGFALHAQHIVLSQSALSADALSLTLPSALVSPGASPTIAGRNVVLRSDGTLGGSVQFPAMNLLLAGFTLVANSIALGNNGLTVGDARLTLPASLLPGGTGTASAAARLASVEGLSTQISAAVTLSGSLSIAPNGAIGGHIDSGAAALSLAGFAIGVANVGLDRTGMSVSNANLTLPASLSPAGATPITLHSDALRISANFQIQGTVSVSAVTLAFGGFRVAADDIALDSNGMVADNASYTLPDQFCGAKLVAASLNIDTRYGVHGAIAAQGACFTYSGFKATVGTMSLDSGGTLVINDAEVKLSGVVDGTLKGDLTATAGGSGAPQVTGSLALNKPKIKYGGFAADADSIALDNGGLHVTNASLTLPGYLSPAGKPPIVLKGSMAIDTNLQVTGVLTATPVDVQYTNLALHADSIALDNGGLRVHNAVLPLPGYVGGATLRGDLTVAPGFITSGTLEVDNTQFIYSAFNVAVAKITYDSSGLLQVMTATVTLPANISTSVPTGNLTGQFDNSGHLSVTGQLTVAPASLNYNGFALAADAITLGSSGMAVTNARYTLPAQYGGATIAGSLAIDPQFHVSGTISIDGSRSQFVYGNFTGHFDLISLDSSGMMQIKNVSVSLGGLSNATIGGDLTATSDASGLHIAGQLHASAQNMTLQYAGFTVQVAQMTLDNSGVAVDGVSLTLPSYLTPPGQDSPVVLAGALHVDASTGSYVVSGYIAITQTVKVAYLGFAVEVGDMRLDNTGLNIGASRLDIPDNIIQGLSQAGITVSGLHISPDFKMTGGQIAGHTNLAFTLFGAQVSVVNLAFTQDAISADQVGVTMPAALGGSGPWTLNHFVLHSDGSVDGAITTPSFSFKLADFGVNAPQGATFSRDGLMVPRLELTLPIFQGGFALDNLVYDGHSIRAGGGGGTAHVALPAISAGDFTILQADADLSMDVNSGTGQIEYALTGHGTLGIPGVATLNADLQIGSVGGDYPSNLHSAALNIEVPAAGIPVPPIFVINGLSGALHITGAPAHVVYTIQLGIDVQTADAGFLLRGNGALTFASDGNFGFGLTGQALRFINAKGGICVRFTARHDYVCESALSNHGHAVDTSPNSTGVYAELSGDIPVGPAHLSGDLYGHLWLDGDGPEIAASVGINATLPAGSFSSISAPFSLFGWTPGISILPCDIKLNAETQLGKFNYNDGTTQYTLRGIKGTVSGNLCDLLKGDKSFLLAFDNSGVHTYLDNQAASFSLVDYSLSDAGRDVAYLRTLLPNGDSTIQRVKVLAAPLHARQAVIPVRIVPGERDVLFTLVRKAGAPSLTLTAPDGTVYTLASPGLGAQAYHVTDPRALQPGYVAADALYVPAPRAGLWHVTVGNLHGGEGYQFGLQGSVPPPTLRVTAPAADRTLVANPTATLRGQLNGGGPFRSLALSYTTAPTTVLGGRTVPNYAGQIIASDVRADSHGRWSYRWDTSALPAGAYYVYATLNNGAGPSVNGYSTGMVRVVQPARPAPPRDVTEVRQNGQLRLMWSPPARAGIIAGYKLHYRIVGSRSSVAYTLDLGNLQSATLNEADPLARYEIGVSAYDLAGHESATAPAWVVTLKPGQQPGGTPPDFHLGLGRLRLSAGGAGTIPLTLRPRGKPSHGPGDFVSFSVTGLPFGVAARPSVAAVDLYAQPMGVAAPVLNVTTPSTLRPGTYRLTVTARQGAGRRTRRAVALLTIRPGNADFVTLRAGRSTRRADRLLNVPVAARVVDASGVPVENGTTVRFASPDGAFRPGSARTRNGVAATTLVYVPGTHPVVTADAIVAQGHLYLGPTRKGARTDSVITVARRDHPVAPATYGDLVLRNDLPAPAQVRLHTDVDVHGITVERITALLVPAHGRLVERLAALAGGYPLLRVEARSDIPLLVWRIARRAPVPTRPGPRRYALAAAWAGVAQCRTTAAGERLCRWWRTS